MNKISYHSSVLDAATGKGTKSMIAVYLAGKNILATIFSNAAGEEKSNPFETDDFGRFVFFADSGEYDIQISGDGILPYKLEQITISGVFTPPVGSCKVKNLYVNPETGKLEVVYDDTPI